MNGAIYVFWKQVGKMVGTQILCVTDKFLGLRGEKKWMKKELV
jgi:hypothetical protein